MKAVTISKPGAMTSGIALGDGAILVGEPGPGRSQVAVPLPAKSVVHYGRLAAR